MTRINLPSAVRAYRARGIAPDATHRVDQGILNLWWYGNAYVGELVIGKSDTSPDAILMESDGAYINTTPPQEIADDIYMQRGGDNTVVALDRSVAAATLGAITSDAKRAASRANGKLGGRPHKQRGESGPG